MVLIKHVALCMDSKDHARSFYQDLLNAELVKEFEVSKSVVKQIFSIDIDQQHLTVMVFENENLLFEIFISKKIARNGLDHVCISVDNLNGFIKQCQSMNITVLKIPKNNKTLVFIKDFSGNLFEIKEK